MDPVTDVMDTSTPQVAQAYPQDDAARFSKQLAQTAPPPTQTGNASGPPSQTPNSELTADQVRDVRDHVKFVFRNGETPEQQEALKQQFDKSISYLAHGGEGWDNIRDRIYNPGDRGQLTVAFIKPTDKPAGVDRTINEQTHTDPQTNRVYWNPYEAVDQNGRILSPAASLGHEIGGHASYTATQHAEFRMRDQNARGQIGLPHAPANDQERRDQSLHAHYPSVEEGTIIDGFEQGQLVPSLNEYRRATGMAGSELVRNNYDGGIAPVNDVLCADTSCVVKK